MEFTSFHQPSLQSIWDFGEEERDSLGFMELLGSQHHSLLLETLQPQAQPFEKLSSSDLTILQAPPSNATADKYVTSKVESLCSDINPPATPNSSSISSASSEAVDEDKAKREENEEHEQQKSDTKKQWVSFMCP